MERRNVQLRCWRYDVPGVSGGDVPVYFLDADLPANEESDRALTGSLYGGDPLYRLRQEVLLGIGGTRMLQALGYTALGRYHMNEGHAALLTLELLAEEALKLGRSSIRAEDIEKIRAKCVFTTHTPVAAGHDRFPLEYLVRLFPDHLNFLDLQDPAAAALLKRVLQTDRSYGDLGEAARDGAYLNMTYLALSLSHFVNAVARQHGETSRKMFPGVRVESITNGVHAATWMSPPFQRLLDRYISYWREDSLALRLALRIPAEAVWAAHQAAKRELLDEVHRKTGLSLDLEAFTIGFARRVTGYKRADLILNNLDRLRQIVRNAGKLQIIYAGKAHPNDTPGQEIIGRIFKAQKALRKSVKTVFLENYNLEARAQDHLGCRLVAQHAAISARGLRHQRNEGGAEWRSEPQHSGWLVGGGTYRGTHRLVDWRIPLRNRLRGSCRQSQRGGLAVFQARARNPALVLSGSRRLFECHAPHHRDQRRVFQYAPHGAGVHHTGLSALRDAIGCATWPTGRALATRAPATGGRKSARGVLTF